MNDFEVGKVYENSDFRVIITQIVNDMFYFLEVPHTENSEVDYFIKGSITYKTLKNRYNNAAFV